MKKTVCDICGKEMPTSKYADTIENLNFCISSHGKIWDICDECRESLNRWMTIRRHGCDEKECSYKAESEPQENKVLDKIRAEIIELRSRQNVGVLECLDIIDKYKAESEEI